LSAPADLLSALGIQEEFGRILQEFRRIPKNSYGMYRFSSGEPMLLLQCLASSALDVLSAQEDLLSASGSLEEFIRILQEFA